MLSSNFDELIKEPILLIIASLWVSIIKRTSSSFFKLLITEPNISANIVWANKVIGTIGKVHPKVLNSFGISGDVYYFELDIQNLPLKKVKKVKEAPKYPSSTRDLSLVVEEKVPVAKLMTEVKKAAGNLCESVEFFDVYQGEQVQKGEKSVAIRLVFRKSDGTLLQEEVNSQVEKVLSEVKQKLNARLREQ